MILFIYRIGDHMSLSDKIFGSYTKNNQNNTTRNSSFFLLLEVFLDF